MIIVVTAICVALGRLAGGALGTPWLGALLGGLAGVIAGFAAIYWRYREL